MVELRRFDEAMESKGWIIFERVASENLIRRMLEDLDRAWHVCREVQRRNGVADDADLTVHHLPVIADSFLELIDAMAPLSPYVERYFGGKYILNSLGGAINTRDRTSYAHRIHRDIRSFSGNLPLLMNTLVMLDDFTPENGATWLCSGSHRCATKPSDEQFRQTAEQAIAPAGSILVFNSNLWHAGGENLTDRARRSVTPMFCRPFMKQQFDYPRALGYDRMSSLSEHTRQIVGYYARVPATLDEWYQPPDKRMYRPDQG